MGKMLFDLSDDDRAALERARIAMGLRSHAETLRAFIRQADGGEAVAVSAPPSRPRPAPAAVSVERRSKTVVAERERPKFTTRLKGEWKAP